MHFEVVKYSLEESIFEVMFDSPGLGLRSLMEVQIFDEQSEVTAFFTFPIPQ